MAATAKPRIKVSGITKVIVVCPQWLPMCPSFEAMAEKVPKRTLFFTVAIKNAI